MWYSVSLYEGIFIKEVGQKIIYFIDHFKSFGYTVQC